MFISTLIFIFLFSIFTLSISNLILSLKFTTLDHLVLQTINELPNNIPSEILITNPIPHSNLENINFFKIHNSPTETFSIDYTISETNTKNMILIHGYNDYHFNHELHNLLLNNGYNVFALTLRNYGQNIKNEEDYFYIDSGFFKNTPTLISYFEEINTTFEFITKITPKTNNNISITAHSCGGLIATIYNSEGKYKHKINKLILNSPFFSPNSGTIMNIGIKNFSAIAYTLITPFAPKFKTNSIEIPDINTPTDTTQQTKFIMTRHAQEIVLNGFDINPYDTIIATNKLPWILNNSPNYIVLANAINQQQKRIRNGTIQKQPLQQVLVLRTNNDELLNSNDIDKYAKSIFGENSNTVKHIQIDNGYHNVFASKLEIRLKFFEEYINFLKQ